MRMSSREWSKQSSNVELVERRCCLPLRTGRNELRNDPIRSFDWLRAQLRWRGRDHFSRRSNRSHKRRANFRSKRLRSFRGERQLHVIRGAQFAVRSWIQNEFRRLGGIGYRAD